MISLFKLLKESQSTPKAIFMGGPAGSGKSTFLKSINLNNFTIINIDDDFEALLQSEIGKLDFSKYSPEELSKAGELMGKARASTRDKETNLISQQQNIIIDGTGAYPNPLIKKKKQLEELGYETFMVIIYVSPLISIERNYSRTRKLPTSAVMKNWEGIISSIERYKQEFGNDIVIINNNPSDSIPNFDPIEIRKKFPNPQGKEKSPEEKEKSIREKETVEQNILNLLKYEIKFNTKEEAISKIKNFIK